MTENSIRARVASYSKWARTSDRSAATAPARAAASSALDLRLAAKFSLDATAPDFAARLAAARKAHFAGLALKSAQARRKARPQAAAV